MNRTLTVLLAAVVGALSPLPLVAVEPSSTSIERSPSGLRFPVQASYSYYERDDEPQEVVQSPSDIVQSPSDVAIEDNIVIDDTGDAWAASVCPECQAACDPGAPWTLPQPCLLQRMGFKVGGWMQQGITMNADDPVDRYNATVALNDRHGEWQVNQLWLYLTRPIDQTAPYLQAGAHVDIVWGSDWRFGRFFGLEEKINSDDQFYGWVFPQMYAEFGGHNLSVKIGHFAGILGYEVVPAVGNFFYSHSLAMSYTEPQLVTGVMADYKLSEQWSVQAGFHRGWFMFEDLNNKLDFMGGIKWQSCDGRLSAAYALSSGNQSPLGENWFASSLVIQYQMTEKFKYVLQHNLGQADDLAAGNDAEWYGINQYLLYTINPCWSLGARIEWMRDDDGTRVAGIGNLLGTNRGWTGGPGYAGDFYELSLGVNWKPKANLWFRPEVRWDWYDGPNNLIDGTRPFSDGQDDSQFTAGFDVIVTY